MGDRVDRARAAMVADQLRRRGVRDERVLAVMASLPRERFVPELPVRAVYDDRALPIDAGQTISQPFVVARMTELLQVERGDRVLEIGTGSGYQAAVLACLGARVRSIERFDLLAEQARRHLASAGIPVVGDAAEVAAIDAEDGDAAAGHAAAGHAAAGGVVEVVVDDGSSGDPTGAPWDGILVTAAAPSIPDALREQLAIGARLVIPVGPRNVQELIVVERVAADEWRETSDGPVVFVPLVGEGGWSG
jgi:protein-L-isoaspartate(D-aspartate) O-methyltransferase